MTDMTITPELSLLANQNSESKNFWTNSLSSQVEPAVFPSRFNSTTKKALTENSYTIDFGDELSEAVFKIANGSDQLLHVILTASVALLLNKTLNTDQVLLGTTLNKQHRSEQQLEVNKVLPLPFQFEQIRSVKELLLQSKKLVSDAQQHQYFPLTVVAESLDKSYPFFNIAVVLDTIQEIEDLPINQDLLVFNFKKKNQSLHLEIQYKSELYRFDSIKRNAERIVSMLNQITDSTDGLLKEISICNARDENLILNEYNEEISEFKFEGGLVSKFWDIAKENPDLIAISDGKVKYTYGEFADRIDRTAFKLIEAGVKPGDVVAILMQRSAATVESIFAILKVGGTYLPLDENSPIRRLEYMLSDSGCRLILSQQELIDRLKNTFSNHFNYQLLAIDDRTEGSNKVEIKISQQNENAYIIYTSGTSGRPKGVLVKRENVLNQVYGLNEKIFANLGENKNFGLVSSFSFDAHVQLTFGALLFGHSLHVFSDAERSDGKLLLEGFNSNDINLSDGTPVHLSMLVNASGNKENSISVDWFIFGGDKLSKGNLKRFFPLLANKTASVTNVYGPTEATVNATYFTITAEKLKELDEIPIGYPLPNYKIYILDANCKLCPPDVPGEIFISGKGIAKGYIKQEKLTAQKFFESPFEIGQTVYKTGDIGMWTSDGSIKYLGRKDDQVKIRGFRIQLEEIETILNLHESILESVVVVRKEEEAENYLCAYFVAEKELSIADLRGYLDNILPTYMIPSRFVRLDEIPKLINNKIDKKRLPAPENNIQSGAKFVAPSSEIEKKVAEIWQHLLKLEQVSTIDNFFNIGGDSIRAIYVLSKVNKQFDTNFKVVDIYQNETIEKFSRLIEANLNNSNLQEEIADALLEIDDIKSKFLQNL